MNKWLSYTLFNRLTMYSIFEYFNIKTKKKRFKSQKFFRGHEVFQVQFLLILFKVNFAGQHDCKYTRLLEQVFTREYSMYNVKIDIQMRQRVQFDWSNALYKKRRVEKEGKAIGRQGQMKNGVSRNSEFAEAAI